MTEDNKDLIESRVAFIQCDAKSCDYKTTDVGDDYKVFLNKPCPNCGASLLTQEDIDSQESMQSILKSINSMARHITGIDMSNGDDRTEILEYEGDGNGGIKITSIGTPSAD